MLPRGSGLLAALTRGSPGWFVLSEPVTARALQRHRLLSTALADKHRALPALSRHRPRALTAPGGWRQPVCTVAVGLFHGASRDPVELLSTAGLRQCGTEGLFTACRHISMQTRSSSGSQRSGASTKAEVEPMKEASAPPSSSDEMGSSDGPPEGGKPNKKEQLKKVFKEYGAVGVSFHIGMSLMSLGMFYLLVSSGIDMAAILCKLGFSEAVVRSKMAAGTSTFVLAYAIHKLFVPVRISVTLVSVPLIVRYLRKTGLFKPPTPAQ